MASPYTPGDPDDDNTYIHRGNTVTEGSCVQPLSWTGQPFICPFLDEYEFTMTTATGGPWTPQRSFDGINWDTCYVYDQFNEKYNSITASQAGTIFTVDGRLRFQLTPPSTGTNTITGFIRAS